MWADKPETTGKTARVYPSGCRYRRDCFLGGAAPIGAIRRRGNLSSPFEVAFIDLFKLGLSMG